MTIKIEPLKCINCGACELGCSFYRDEVFTTMSASIMMYREEKRNYFGLMLKKDEEMVLGRPEGVEVQKDGESSGEEEEANASAKPILMREPCDECKNAMCVRFCPTGCLIEVD